MTWQTDASQAAGLLHFFLLAHQVIGRRRILLAFLEFLLDHKMQGLPGHSLCGKLSPSALCPLSDREMQM